MIYFDNAATSWPKPEEVYKAAENYLRNGGANPGRSGHTRSIDADRLVYEARERAATILGAGEPEEIVFTFNATDSLNMAIKGVLEPGDHVIYTSFEHNSVLRPLTSLRRNGTITATMIACDASGNIDIQDIEKAILPNTRLIVCTHASNVIGTVLPVKEISKLARNYGILFLLDAAQTAGSIPINLQEIKPHLAAFTGHKGLLGPPGVGLLYVRKGVSIKPWREGGTGSRSEEEQQPEMMPDYLEAGTMNTPGIAGLNEGLKFIEKTGISTITEREFRLAYKLRAGLRDIGRVKLFEPVREHQSVAVVSFIVEGFDSGELGYVLEQAYGILCRTGLHCAPWAHRTIGSFPQGTVRFSLGYFNREEEVEHALKALREIVCRF
ncbi:MAG TPA: aminotransferase class V-fold PLP-dependent enzyme [Firmicutes bacterium]|nr:aminotransferase class V-fold PLP-dependent enzyme [Bacillota bacterium]